MNTSGISYNIQDTEIENEMNKLRDISLLNLRVAEGNSTKEMNLNDFIDDINFDDYDEIFEIHTKKGKKKKIESKVKIDKEEINKYYKQYEKTIEIEINKELKETFNPLDIILESDRERANYLINNSNFIKKAVDEVIITFDEVVYFIDYYELLSLMEKKKFLAVDTLQKISNLFEEDETWENLQNQLEKTLNQTNIILSNKIDMRKLLYDYQERKDENVFYENFNYDASTDNLNSKGGCNLNNYNNINKSPQKDSLFTTKRVNKISTPHNELRDSKSSIKSTISNKPKPIKPVHDLFNDHNKMTNLLKVRNDRRELIKVLKGDRVSSRPDLFKFDYKDIKYQRLNINNQELENKFKEFLQMPKKVLEETNYDNNDQKKNTIRRRIQDAVNFFKNNPTKYNK